MFFCTRYTNSSKSKNILWWHWPMASHHPVPLVVTLLYWRAQVLPPCVWLSICQRVVARFLTSSFQRFLSHAVKKASCWENRVLLSLCVIFEHKRNHQKVDRVRPEWKHVFWFFNLTVTDIKHLALEFVPYLVQKKILYTCTYHSSL